MSIPESHDDATLTYYWFNLTYGVEYQVFVKGVRSNIESEWELVDEIETGKCYTYVYNEWIYIYISTKSGVNNFLVLTLTALIDMAFKSFMFVLFKSILLVDFY